MAYGVSYTLVGFDTPLYSPTPGFFIGKIYSNPAGYSPLVLSYQSPFYQSPRFYSGGVQVETSLPVTATLTADATHAGVASATSNITVTLSSSAALSTLLAAQSSVTAGLVANSYTNRLADSTLAVTTSLSTDTRRNTTGQETTPITASLTADVVKNMSVGASLAVTSTQTSVATRVYFANVSTAVTASLTDVARKDMIVGADLAITETSINQISTLYTTTTDPLNVTAGLTGEIIRGHTVNAQTPVAFTFTAKIKKSNQFTDHDILVFGEVMPRRWVGQLGDTRWVATLATQRNWAGSLPTKRWANGILVDRNKFATLADRRWRGNLQ